MKDSDWEILRELYHNPNMTKVADLLYMTQPSLTKRLHHIEDEFQVEIVRRTPKGLEFTPEGEYLAQRAERYQEFQQETQRGLDALRQGRTQQIIIGSSYTFSKYRLTDVLVGYRKRHPETRFQVVNEQSNILFRKVLDGTVDVAFLRGDYEGAVNQVLVGRDQGYLVTQEPVALEELPRMQRYDYRTNDRTKEVLDSWWRDRFGGEPPVGMSVGYIDFIGQVLRQSPGYACCFLPPAFGDEQGLCLTPLTYRDGRPVVRNTWFVYPKSKRLDTHLEAFVDYVRRELALPKSPV